MDILGGFFGVFGILEVFGVFFGEHADATTTGMDKAIGYNVVSLSNVTYSKPLNRDEFYCIAIGY